MGVGPGEGRTAKIVSFRMTADHGQIPGQNLGRVFSSRCGRACLRRAIMPITKTAKLNDEN